MLSDNNQLRDICKLVLAAWILLLVSLGPESLQLKNSGRRIQTKELLLLNCAYADVNLQKMTFIFH